jgi:hypothetical protein
MTRSNRRCRIVIAITTVLITIQWSGQLTVQGGNKPGADTGRGPVTLAASSPVVDSAR